MNYLLGFKLNTVPLYSFLFQMKINYLAMSTFLTMTGRAGLQMDNMGLRVRGNGTPFINTDSVVDKSESSTVCASLEFVQTGPTARRELVERLFIVICTFFRT